MQWYEGIACSVIGGLFWFLVERFRSHRQRRAAGQTGCAHEIVEEIGPISKPFEGRYYLSETADDNYTTVNHIYQRASGEVIATSFRENPSRYTDKDLARNLKKRVADFTRISSSTICTEADARSARQVLNQILPGASLVVVPQDTSTTCVDGLFCKLYDDTYLAFVTFPTTKEYSHNRGILFYGNIARAFFEYYRDLRDMFKVQDNSSEC